MTAIKEEDTRLNPYERRELNYKHSGKKRRDGKG